MNARRHLAFLPIREREKPGIQPHCGRRKKNMAIAFVVGGFPILSETFILNQITGLLEMGHDVEIFSLFKPPEGKTHPDVNKYRLMEKTHYFAMPENKARRALRALRLLFANFHKAPLKLLRSLNFFKHGRDAASLKLFYALIPFLGKDFDIIQCHFGPNGNFIAPLKDIFIKGKLVTTFHGYDIRDGIEKGGRIYSRLFRSGDLILACSAYSYEHLIRFGSNPDRTAIHPAGIDIKKYSFHPKAASGQVSDITFLSVSRLVEEKGLQYGVEAIYLLKKKNPALRVRYVIIGGGPLEKKLKRMCEQLDLKEDVRFMGWMDQNEIIEKMREADIFLLPSVAEANPVVLMEARATGLPAIATSVGSIPDTVPDGVSGFLVPPRNAEALAEKMEYLAGHPELRERMGFNGRQVVEQMHDIDKLNRRLAEMYEKLLDAKAAMTA